MAINTGYLDIGVFQHKDSGVATANTGYKDIGVFQHQAPTGGTGGIGGLWLRRRRRERDRLEKR